MITWRKKNRRRSGARSVGLGLSLAAALLLTGCTDMLLSSGPPPAYFTLSPKSTFDENLPTVDWQLVVEKPVTSGSLATQRVALTQDPMQIEYFANARWSEAAPQLIQTLLVESFENSNKIVAVGRQAIGLRSDFNLKSELREFQAEYGGDKVPTVRVRINAKIIRQARRQIIASRTFEKQVKAKGSSMAAVIRAFDNALGKILKRIVGWTLITADAAKPRRSG